MPYTDSSRFRRYDPFANRPPKRVSGEGPIPAQCMFIGEKPGRAEARRGRPFIGPAGDYLNICLQAANVERKDIYITNLVKEFTEYSKPTAEEIARDHEELVAEIVMADPEVIALIGGWAVEHVLYRERAEMEKVHGVPIHVESLFGGELTRPGGYTVIPLLHPAGATHSPDTLPHILDDVLQLGRLLDHEIAVREDDPFKGREDYRLQSADEGVVTVTAAIDTEGSRLAPWCATWSTLAGRSRLVHSPNRTIFKGKVYLHNSLHDLGVLRTMGIELEEGQYRDTMILAYILCIEPQGLKPLAYRHCAMLQDDYDDIVRDARIDKAITYLMSAADIEWPKADPQVIEDAGRWRVYKPKSVNTRINKIIDDHVKYQIGAREEEVDLRKRWNDVDDVIKAPVIEILGDMPDATLDDVPYDRACFYANRDSDATLRVAPILEQKIIDMDLVETARIDHAILPMLDSMQHNGIRLAPPEFWNGIEDQCDKQMDRAKAAIFRDTGEDINPGSGKQVAALLYDKLGLTPPKLTDSGERGSVNALCLESLLGENPVVQHVMDYTEASKIRGTYVYPLRKLCTVGDRRVRSTIRSTRTTTGRLSMADPPLHQIPIMTDLGRQLRGGFIAEGGSVLYDIDVDQLEMRIMAHDSRDSELCRLFDEGRDIHAETACSIFSVPMSALSVGPTGKVSDYRRIVAKHCVAEGELVLTDRGLVPIQNITLQHKLWDGVEWVSHEGVIDQGIREVITYDGLTATPDHEVFTEAGTICAFGEAASSLARLHTTGDAEQALRSRHRGFLESSAQERIHRAEMQMYEVWKSELEDEVESYGAGIQGVPLVQPHQVRQGFSQPSSGALRRYIPALHQPEVSRIRGLRRQRYSVPVPVEIRVCVLGDEEFAAQGLYRDYDRSNRQQRSLRPRQSSLGFHESAEPESTEYTSSNVRGGTDISSRFREPIQLFMDVETDTAGSYRRADYNAGQTLRVYDIVNSGPRRCFTVGNNLVVNCAFGIINGITEHGIVNYMIINRCKRPDGLSWTLDDCVIMRKEWFKKYKGVERFHHACMEETRQTGLARETIGGRIIYLPQIWSPVKKVRETAERMSYVMHTQGGGQSLIKRCMAAVWQGVCKKHRGVKSLLQMHDELLFELPDNEPLKKDVDDTATRLFCNTVKLRIPVKASGGFAGNWLEAH